jgi:hypothetical protein
LGFGSRGEFPRLLLARDILCAETGP